MAGTKGHSGRNTNRQERLMWAVINNAWDILNEALKDSTVLRSTKIEIALKICPRSIPQSPLIDQSQHLHKTFVYLDPKAKEEETGKNRIISQLPAE